MCLCLNTLCAEWNPHIIHIICAKPATLNILASFYPRTTECGLLPQTHTHKPSPLILCLSSSQSASPGVHSCVRACSCVCICERVRVAVRFCAVRTCARLDENRSLFVQQHHQQFVACSQTRRVCVWLCLCVSLSFGVTPIFVAPSDSCAHIAQHNSKETAHCSG